MSVEVKDPQIFPSTAILLDSKVLADWMINVGDDPYTGMGMEDEKLTIEWLTDSKRKVYYVEDAAGGLVHYLIVIEVVDGWRVDWHILGGNGWVIQQRYKELAPNENLNIPDDVCHMAYGSWVNNRYLHNVHSSGWSDNNFVSEMKSAFADLWTVLNQHYGLKVR